MSHVEELTVVVEVSGDLALLAPGVHLRQVSPQLLAVAPGTRPGQGPDNEETMQRNLGIAHTGKYANLLTLALSGLKKAT